MTNSNRKECTECDCNKAGCGCDCHKEEKSAIDVMMEHSEKVAKDIFDTPPKEEKIEIVPSPRIDWCGACKISSTMLY